MSATDSTLVWNKPTQGEIAGTVTYRGRTFRGRVDERQGGVTEARLWPGATNAGVSRFTTLATGDAALKALADHVFGVLERPSAERLAAALVSGFGWGLTEDIQGVRIVSGEREYTPDDHNKHFRSVSAVESLDGAFKAVVTMLTPIRPTTGLPRRVISVEFVGDTTAFQLWCAAAKSTPDPKDPKRSTLFWMDTYLVAWCDASVAWVQP